MNLKYKLRNIKERLRPYTPSENFVTNLGIVLGVLFILFQIPKLPKHFENISEKQNIKRNFAGMTVEEIKTRDTDSDGVLDWEEYLWGTDPQKKDSDGDGTSDLEYVEEKRLEIQRETGVTGLPQDSRTSQLAEEYFSTIIALEESGGLTTEALTNLALSFTDSISETDLPDVFSKETLTSGPSTKYDIQKYKDTVSLKLSENGGSVIGLEFGYIDQLIRDKSTKESSKTTLEGIASSYKIFATSLSDISVPSEVTEEHVAFINALYNTGLSIEKTSSFWDDPISGIEGLIQYKEYSSKVEESLAFFEDYFSKNGII